jgi:hypothetical protein
MKEPCFAALLPDVSGPAWYMFCKSHRFSGYSLPPYAPAFNAAHMEAGSETAQGNQMANPDDSNCPFSQGICTSYSSTRAAASRSWLSLQLEGVQQLEVM